HGGEAPEDPRLGPPPRHRHLLPRRGLADHPGCGFGTLVAGQPAGRRAGGEAGECHERTGRDRGATVMARVLDELLEHGRTSTGKGEDVDRMVGALMWRSVGIEG